MFSQFFVLSLRGDTILHKDCKYLEQQHKHKLKHREVHEQQLKWVCLEEDEEAKVYTNERYSEYMGQRPS